MLLKSEYNLLGLIDSVETLNNDAQYLHIVLIVFCWMCYVR